jgi:hypothetical protein
MAYNPQAPQKGQQPLWIKKTNPKHEKLLGKTYRWNEIIVFFKKPPTTQETEEIKKSFVKDGIDPASIEILKCDNCNIPVQLWKAKNIHTVVNTEGVRAGSGPTTTSTVGEEYSLNFFNSFPFEKNYRLGKHPLQPQNIDGNKEKIIVAVLDTGFDTRLIDSKYLWQGKAKRTDPKCYKEITTGWNFIDNTGDFHDDSLNKHGSIVSQYIINQFAKSPYHAVQIMPLKTHDQKGIGDLFSVICAIHFAIVKGANIINASWGFYHYYMAFPIPYLKDLITVTLKQKGILFVTASGNKDDAEEVIARQIYQDEYGVAISADQLRNLAIHNFYPARLSSDDNSIITVGTTDGKTVSPTQNYSNTYADLGVLADEVTPDSMKFRLPFAGGSSGDLISGSSFATAIASGVIGAFCKKSLYRANVEKQQFIEALAALSSMGAGAGVLSKSPVLEKKYIKKGVYTKRIG